MNNFVSLPTSLNQAFVLDLKLDQELTKYSDRITFLAVSAQILFSCWGSFFAEGYCTGTLYFQFLCAVVLGTVLVYEPLPSLLSARGKQLKELLQR